MEPICAFFQVIAAHVLRLQKTYTALCISIVIVLPLMLYSVRPLLQPTHEVTIEQGMSVTQAGKVLKREHVISSVLLFRVLLLLQHGSVKSGMYTFPHSDYIWTVVSRIEEGKTGTVAIRFLIPEGSTRLQIATLLHEKVPTIAIEDCMQKTASDEGYLFPDTYFLEGDESADVVIRVLKANYTAHRGWYDDSAKLRFSERDAVTLASLLEGEANTQKDREMVAGILLHRLALGMRLQVDAPFGYERGIAGYVPTPKDIETSTPYNTYRNKGLTPTPINNPGYDALYAATHPIETPYLFYLTGSDGVMHYARTFAEHIQNQKTYFK